MISPRACLFLLPFDATAEEEQGSEVLPAAPWRKKRQFIREARYAEI